MTRSTVSGGQAVYDVLVANDVSTVFGLLGGSMLELYDAMYTGGAIRYIGARDERAAGHMADVYARISGGPGVVLAAQAGPGVVNLVTAVAEAHLAYSPLVAIAGAISRSDQGKDTFQEVDQVALFAPICKRSVMVSDPNRLGAMLMDAIRLAMSGRRGPVVVHVPRDVFAAEVERPAAAGVTVAEMGAPCEKQVQEILRLLANAERPVIVAGGGLKSAQGSHRLLSLAERLEVPVVAATGHADVMPHGHRLYAGQGGPRGNRVASRLTKEADVILALGTRLGFNSTFHSFDYIGREASIIQIDIEASAIGRYFPVVLGIQADAVASAVAIAANAEAGVRAKDWLARFETELSGLRSERAGEANDATMPMHPRRALAEIREALPKEAIVTLDTGNACLQAADRLAHYECPGLITPLDFGLVGFGYAGAIGAQAAAPDRSVVCVIGDGGFGYTLAEITTAVAHQLPVIAVVLDNGAWGAEKAYQQTFFGGRLLGADLNNPPYDEVAKLCGASGYRAEHPGELSVALEQALSLRKPAVIHTKIDPSALSTLRNDLFTKE